MVRNFKLDNSHIFGSFNTHCIFMTIQILASNLSNAFFAIADKAGLALAFVRSFFIYAIGIFRTIMSSTWTLIKVLASWPSTCSISLIAFTMGSLRLGNDYAVTIFVAFQCQARIIFISFSLNKTCHWKSYYLQWKRILLIGTSSSYTWLCTSSFLS